MEHIDFTAEKMELHRRIVAAIRELMEARGVKELDLEEGGAGNAYAVVCDGYGSTRELVQNIAKLT